LKRCLASAALAVVSCALEMRQYADGLVPHHAGVVENLLDLSGGSAALVRRQISLATQINGVES